MTIGFSAPAADHGWIAAIANNAQAQAGQYPDVTLEAVNPTNDITQQIAAVDTLINKKVDALVVLPNDGSQLTSLGRKAMEAGIPVINLDRIFDSPLAYRTWIGGDNYGMGVSAGTYVGERLTAAGVANPVIGEIAGIDNLPLTQAAQPGLRRRAELATASRSDPARRPTSPRRAAQRVTANLLQAAPKLDALWNHDDDQGIGVLAAINQAGRNEFFMVGGAGSANAMRDIKADNTVLKATVTYSPSMASSAIALARLVAQGKGMSDLVEKEVPTLDHAGLGDDHQGERATTTCPSASSPDRRDPELRSPLGVGMVGYAFMGAAHSQAWRTAGRFFDLPVAPGHGGALRPRRCGGRPPRRPRLGWRSVETDWKQLLDPRRRRPGRHLHARGTRTPRSRSPRSTPASTCCARSRWPTPSTEARGDGRRGRAGAGRGVRAMVGFNYRRVPAVALARRLVADGRLGQVRHVRAQYLQDWIVDPEFPLVWRLQKDKAGSGALGRHRRAHRRHGAVRHRRPAHRRLGAHRDVRHGAAAARGVHRAVRVGRHRSTARSPWTTPRCSSAGSPAGRWRRFEATRFATGRKNAIRLEINGSRGLARVRLRGDERAAVLRRHRGPARPPASAGSSSPSRRTRTSAPGGRPGTASGYEHTFIHEVVDLVTRHRRGTGPDAVVRRRAAGAAGARRRRAARAASRQLPGTTRRPRGELTMARPITLFTGQWADLPFEEVCRLAAEWGYDGLEIACWGDHLDVVGRGRGRRLRRRAGATCWRSTA